MKDTKAYLDGLKQELTHYKKVVDDASRGKKNKEGEKVYKALQRTLQEAGEAYEKLASASAEEWEPLKKIASQSFEDLKSAFEGLKDSVSGKAKDYVHQIEDYSEEAFETSVDYIKANPFKSILLASGIGFILGKLSK